MPNTLAEYYADELIDWQQTITFYIEEMSDLEQKLSEVISRNSIVGIAEQVENQQNKLNAVSKTFYLLQTKFKQQEARLKTDSTYIDNTLIDTSIEKEQVELRQKMQQTEKEYIDTKYACYNFLSGTLKK
jgi:predicted RND superfamily exporter protein